MRIITVLLFLVCNFPSFGNDSQCSREYIDLEFKAESILDLVLDNNAEEALSLCVELESKLENKDSDISINQKIYLITKISQGFDKLRETKKGIEVFEKYLKLAEDNLDSDSYELGKFYEAGGSLYEYMKDNVRAKHYLLKALDILKNYSGESGIHLELAWHYFVVEKNYLAIEHFEKSLELYDYSDKSALNRVNLMNTYLMSTGALIRVKNFGAALNYLYKAEELISEIRTDRREFYLNIKFAEYFITVNNPEKAIEYLSREIPNSQKGNSLMSTYNFYTATAMYQTNRFSKAVEYYTKSLNRDLRDAENGLALRIRDIAENYKQIGLSYHGLCDYSKALENLNLSLHYLNKEDGYNTSIAETYEGIAAANINMSRLDSALYYNHLALNAHDEDLVGVLNCNLRSSNIYLEYFMDTNNFGYVDSIITYLNKNDLLINDIRHNQRFYEESEDRDAQINAVYSESLVILNYLNRVDKRDHILNKIFIYMEGIKSYKLKQELKSNEGLVKFGIPEKVIEDDLAFKENINTIQKEIYKIQQDSSLSNSLSVKEKELDDLKIDYIQFLKNIESKHSSYYEFKYNYSSIDLKQLQQKLRDNEAVIEYFDNDNSLFVLAITTDEARYYDVNKPDNWSDIVNRYSVSVSDPNYLHQDSLHVSYHLFTQASNDIYNTILKDAIHDLDTDVNTLVFIPDQNLHFIQFDNLLRSKAGSDIDFKNLDYLINDFTTSRASSSFIFSQLRDNNRHKKELNYLGVAPFYQDDRKIVIDSLETDRKRKQEYYNDLVTRGSMVDLPLARESVSFITEIMDGVSFVGKEATKFSLTENVDKANIFHFAGHAIVDVEDPQFSQLLFPYEEIDSQLYATDIYDISLNIDLAVLSACNTGNGKLKSGEGVMSLSRAFQFAGCNSLVLSLWNIPDVQTAELDKLFFEEINEGKRIDEALRSSKLTFLQSATYKTAHPFYWSGLTASGKMEPVHKQSLLDTFCSYFRSLI